MTAPVEAAAVEPAAPATATPSVPPAPSPASMPQTQTSAAAAPTTEQPIEGDGKDPEQSAREAKLGREAAKYRTERNELQQRLAAIEAKEAAKDAELAEAKDWRAKVAALLNPDANEPPDPAKLAEQLTAEQAKTAKVEADYQAQVRDLTIRAALPGALAKANAKAITEKVLKADGVLAKLDPMSDTFEADLASAVNAALESDPDLKVAPVAARTARSGAEIPGRSGGSNQLTLEQVRGMKPADIDKARREGRLTSLGVGAG